MIVGLRKVEINSKYFWWSILIKGSCAELDENYWILLISRLCRSNTWVTVPDGFRPRIRFWSMKPHERYNGKSWFEQKAQQGIGGRGWVNWNEGTSGRKASQFESDHRRVLQAPRFSQDARKRHLFYRWMQGIFNFFLKSW